MGMAEHVLGGGRAKLSPNVRSNPTHGQGPDYGRTTPSARKRAVAPVDRSQLRDLLRDARVWGAEIDIRFRVLALTVEPPRPADATGDPRLQVLLYPVSAVGVSLVEDTEDGVVVRRFEEDQLPDIVALFEGAATTTEPLPDRPADLDALAPRLSMRGHASVGDGVLHHLHLHLEADELAFDLWASFDEVEVRGPDQWDQALPD